MQGPIHSKGIGRSGPKRKTGCLTCRRRKVRCDETRPVCANCIRLRLDCDYAIAKDGSTARDATPIQAPRRLSSLSASQGSYIEHDQASILSSAAYMLPSGSTTPYSEEHGMWSIQTQAPVSFDVPMATQSFPSFDNFDLNMAFAGSAEAFFGPDSSFSGSMNQAAMTVPMADATFSIPKVTVPSNDNARRQLLMEHFSESMNPTSLVEPTPMRWNASRQGILNQGHECPSLMSAILAVASLNVYHTKGEDCIAEAIEYYKSASVESNTFLDNPLLDERQLKQAFAASFFLVYAELLSRSVTRSKQYAFPLRHLRTFHHRLHQHHLRLQSWTGISRRLLVWTSMLSIKAEWSSGDLALQHSSSSLKFLSAKPTIDARSISPTSDGNSHSNSGSQSGDTEKGPSTDFLDETSTTFALTYDTLNNPGYDFHLASQIHISRILAIHRETQEAMTSYMNLETVNAGQKLGAELQALWSSRPGTMNFIINADALENILQPELAQTIILNLRVYAANFFALLVDLHRSAFAAYPASKDSSTAVRRIVALAREILHDANRRRSLQGLSPSNSTRSGGATSGTETAKIDQIVEAISSRGSSTGASAVEMPPMMLWPLFLAATEGTQSERTWILNILQRMDERSCPTAARIVPLLQETLRRQDEEGLRVDHRVVGKEFFGAEMAVFF